ncbi:hypothetical protein L1987_23505 [Smallanthus sonchifolius]|uniref:Uncharacterized protein n=1 Tax=Smallanthus sonchifolius TaxID=185202 RepID=A0ACB9IJL9_9ASTR|nr:hypothetical protein L1987_23505 [Smallanthus sonchifolius]
MDRWRRQTFGETFSFSGRPFRFEVLSRLSGEACSSDYGEDERHPYTRDFSGRSRVSVNKSQLWSMPVNKSQLWSTSVNIRNDERVCIREDRVAHKSYSSYVYRGIQAGCIPNVVTYSKNTVYRNIIRSLR